MTNEALHVFKDEENGVESRVFFNSKHYGVTVLDVDSGETLPVVSFFIEEGKAIDYAKQVAGLIPCGPISVSL